MYSEQEYQSTTAESPAAEPFQPAASSTGPSPTTLRRLKCLQDASDLKERMEKALKRAKEIEKSELAALRKEEKKHRDLWKQSAGSMLGKLFFPAGTGTPTKSIEEIRALLESMVPHKEIE